MKVSDDAESYLEHRAKVKQNREGLGGQCRFQLPKFRKDQPWDGPYDEEELTSMGEWNPESPFQGGQWPLGKDQPQENWLPLSSDLGLLTIKGSCFDKQLAELDSKGHDEVTANKDGGKLPVDLAPIE